MLLRRFLFVLAMVFASGAGAAATPAPLLVLGDSLSAAHGIALQDGWVTLLQKRLQESPSPRAVVNASISGETTAGGLARLPALLAEHAPAVVVVELGANDGLRGLPLAEAKANLAKMLEAIRAAHAKAVLVGIELPVNYGPQYRDGLRAMYRGLADEFNVPLVPFLLDGVALDPGLMQDDGLHPNAKAQPKLLDNVWRVLEPVLRAGSLRGRKVRGEKSAARGQFFDDSPAHGWRYGPRSGGKMDRVAGFAARTASAARAPNPRPAAT